MTVTSHVQPDAAILAQRLAQRVAEAVTARLRQGEAGLIVSGGRTPAAFLRALAARTLDWPRVHVTLADERWVDEADPRSNAALVRRTLLQGPAAAAHFTPLHRNTATPESALAAIEADLQRLPPIAAVVLGMGEDGHTASLFPGADNLSAALDPSGASRVMAMRAPGAAEPRVTLTLSALLNADVALLHIEGAAKQATLQRAFENGPVTEMPVRAILRQTETPVEIWQA